MKLFTKLALVSAVAISSNAMAMQAMDDAALSATTGQDGISIGIGISRITIDKVHVFDGDGLAANATLADGDSTANPVVPNTAIVGGTGAAGAITINNISLTANPASLLQSHNLADVTIDTDGNGGSPFLNIGAAVSGLNISLGKIEVNDVTGTAGAYVAGTGSAEILSGLSLKTGKMTANVQLGNTPQGAMIKLDGKMVGGLEIKNLALKDASAGGGGYIAIGGIKLKDTVGSDLSLDTDIAVKPKGLAITAMKNSTDIYVTKVMLGGGTLATPGDAFSGGTTAGAASIGDIAISGMKVYNGFCDV